MARLEHLPVVPPFTGMALDRVSIQRKDDGWVAQRALQPESRMVLAGRDAIALARFADGPEEVLRRPLVAPPDDLILLGLEDAGPALFAVDLEGIEDAERSRLLDGAEVVSLRDAGCRLPADEGGLAAYAVALLNWHRRHGFCPNCGHATDLAEAGYSRHCPHCAAHHFPRTDPVVIMTVEHDGRLLLGRRSGWPDRRLSVLAGFVSPGESAEEAVVREVQEESGILARDPVFVASQPWPFPASLMLGFHAVSDGGQPRATDGELEEVDWVELDQVRAAVRGEPADFLLPPGVSVARFLIERWVAARDAGRRSAERAG
jgi:NAD+ diphosphatase